MTDHPTDGELARELFEREERFIVVKRKHLKPGDEIRLQDFLRDHEIDTVECVVVEADWPEYETVWQMIEARCTPEQPTNTDHTDAALADDAMIEAAARQMAKEESASCKTLDAALLHQDNWRRLIPEARAIVNAALAARTPATVNAEQPEGVEREQAIRIEAIKHKMQHCRDELNTAIEMAVDAHLAALAAAKPKETVSLLREARDALAGLLRHSCVADSAPEDKDGVDHHLESEARRVITSIDATLTNGDG
jgi:hypothetical protein